MLPRHPLAWLLWLAFAFTAALTTRNPLYLIVVLLALVVVYQAAGARSATGAAWSAFIRVGIFFAIIGFAGGLRRSEIVSLDHGKYDTPDSGGWVEIMEDGALITLRGKTGWREVEIGRGSSDQSCPVHSLSQWLHYSKIDFGPLFVAVSRNGLKATDERLSDKHVARLIKSCVREAGLRPDLPETERLRRFSGHSLRAGLATSAEVDERFVQKQLGHASAEMTRRYQRRRDRFRVNLTKAAGL